MINTTKHIKPLNKQACSPHGYKVNQTHRVCLREGALGYWSAGLHWKVFFQWQWCFFNLNTQKTQINDAKWRIAA